MPFQLYFLGGARCLSSSPVNLVHANSVCEWQRSRTEQQTELLWKLLKLIWSNCGCSHGKEREVSKGFSLEGGDARQWELRDLRSTWARYAEGGGGIAQLCGPSRTVSSHVSSVCSTLCFTAAFHSQFWALAVKMVLCKFLCLSSRSCWSVRGPQARRTLFLGWRNDAQSSCKGYPSWWGEALAGQWPPVLHNEVNMPQTNKSKGQICSVNNFRVTYLIFSNGTNIEVS